MPFIFFNPEYMLIMGIGLVISLIASGIVKYAYAKYSRIGGAMGYTGAEVARRVMSDNGIDDVSIEPVQGFLSDHYDPRGKVLRLSPGNYHGRSLAAIGVAAHEAGHAIQHSRSYMPMKLRSGLVPLAGIGNQAGLYMVIIGIAMGWLGFAKLGVILFAAFFLFQVVTLPVEFNASSRAKRALADSGLVADSRELAGVSSVLNAAALTYVAAAVSTLLILLYFLMRTGLLGGGRND